MTQPTYQIVMQAGPNVGERYPLDQDVLFVGRDLQNDIVVADVEVSRRHARLIRQADGSYLIEDLGSTNGTFVNGRRVAGQQALKRGDVIMLGSKVLFEVEMVSLDPNATVVAVPPQPVEEPPPKQAPAAPPPAFVGQVPQSPRSTDRLTPPAKKKSSAGLLIGCGLALALCCIVTAGVLWYIDSHFLWCTVLPILPGCP